MKNRKQKTTHSRANSQILSASRRSFLKIGSIIGTLAVGATAGLGSTILTQRKSKAVEVGSLNLSQRQEKAFQIRRDAAQGYLEQKLESQSTNGDEERYADKRACFSKTLPHNELGEVDSKAYAALLSALASGDPARFEEIPLAPQAEAKLNNPQATYAFELVSIDSHATRLEPPPAFASAKMASEMGEVYWQALTIDVPFREYESNQLIAAAVSDLNTFSEPIGSKSSEKVTPVTLFRGETAGDLVGPYVSQLLWLNIPYGIKTIDQQYTFPTRRQAFLTDYQAWLDCQRGVKPKTKLQFDSQLRFICSNREMAEFVHQDFSFQPYLNAALIILELGNEAMSATNPYHNSKTQFGDITFGNKNVLSMVALAGLLGQKGAWYQKWLVHRRLRPESFAGRIENQLSGKKSYDIHTDILNCEAVSRLMSANRTRLLPVAYAEGCPTHPAYPAAHACTAGACATVLKAFFNEDFVIPKPVQATADGLALESWQGETLTLGSEINKLASNISLGRDAGGVHYRADGIQGMLVGEDMGIGLLRDYSRTYNERFDGFVLTKFDGKKVKIVNGEVSSV
jgi:hypothetical protein